MEGPGALAGIRILEIAGLGPAPFAGMMLADHGAEVIAIHRRSTVYPGDPRRNVLNRSRRSIVLDLQKPEAVRIVKELAQSCDALIEGFRPGVMERLGLGPDELLRLNPRLVYGRMTGWGQDGPMAQVAGHDINYIALTGALDSCRRAGERPMPPVNMLGDFGGGGMLLAFGILAGILSARATGRGQVIDAAMTDGSALLTSMIWTMRAQGRWQDVPGTNLLDTGAPYYEVYETKDGQYIALGAIEPKFYADMREALGVADDPEFDDQTCVARWPERKAKVAELVAMRSRDEWCAMFEARDACFAPVLSLAEAPEHPHNIARETFIRAGDMVQPAPAPRFAQSGTVSPIMPDSPDRDAAAILAALNYDPAQIDGLRKSGALG